ncbi:hypothetical protein CDV31_016335 [Fusarium ambrosium]|uniref:CCHC-type domain-containing protein n=1 Tax=Fusarium ambrosium TaxID=131363 RepID=A0A428SAT7_9HYPO|nr:hypothetical protein CDV31_016335 [Fusarium ambrosium]
MSSAPSPASASQVAQVSDPNPLLYLSHTAAVLASVNQLTKKRKKKSFPHINNINTSNINTSNSINSINNMVHRGSNRGSRGHHLGPANTRPNQGSSNTRPPQSSSASSSSAAPNPNWADVLGPPSSSTPSDGGLSARGRRLRGPWGRGEQGGQGGGYYNGYTQQPQNSVPQMTSRSPGTFGQLAYGQQTLGQQTFGHLMPHMAPEPAANFGYQGYGEQTYVPPQRFGQQAYEQQPFTPEVSGVPQMTFGQQAYGPPAHPHGYAHGNGQQLQRSSGQGNGIKVGEKIGVKPDPLESGKYVVSLHNPSKRGGQQENVVAKLPEINPAVIANATPSVAKRGIDEVVARSETGRVTVVVWPQPKRSKLAKRSNLDFVPNLFLGNGNEGTTGSEVADAEGITRCPNCRKEGHAIRECMLPRSDGYVYGCIYCNTMSHNTAKCSKHPREIEKQVESLVSERINMPALKGSDWYPVLWAYLDDNPREPTPDVFPWTPKFGIECRRDDLLWMRAEESMEKEDPGLRPIDPRGESWETIQDAFGGDPRK